MSFLGKKWIYAKNENKNFFENLILNRCKKEEINSFINYDISKDLPTFEKFEFLYDTMEMVKSELLKNKKIVIWGDYDVDGITSTTLLKDFLDKRGFGKNVFVYFPSRVEEGYGLSKKGVDYLKEKNFETIITVDCGVSAHEEITYAKEKDITVIVTDHHLPSDTLPDAEIIFNPKVGNNIYRDFAGVGVAFYLCSCLNKNLPGDKISMQHFMDILALGTVADMVPLTGPNRIFVKEGLKYIDKNLRPGIKCLKQFFGTSEKPTNTETISFMLAPAINAAGRLGKPEIAFMLLMEKDETKAFTLAKQLFELNEYRKNIEKNIFEEAIRQAKEHQADPFILVHHPDWHEGVIGIVASKLQNYFYKPVIILTQGQGGHFKGSARSIEGYHIFEGLTRNKGYLLGFGGHSQAAGLQIKEEHIESFKKAMIEDVLNNTKKEDLEQTLLIEGKIHSSWLNETFMDQYENIGPFGMGNPEAYFETESVEIVNKFMAGNCKQHMFLTLKSENSTFFKAKMWGVGERHQNLNVGNRVILVGAPKYNYFNGNTTVEMDIQDIELL